MAKQYRASAGGPPQFVTGSVSQAARPARVTGKRLNGAHSIVNSEYESRDVKGHYNHVAYVAECDCPAPGRPSQATLERAANAYLYGSDQIAVNRNSREFHDNPANRCTDCHLLKSRNGNCNCTAEAIPVMPFRPAKRR